MKEGSSCSRPFLLSYTDDEKNNLYKCQMHGVLYIFSFTGQNIQKAFPSHRFVRWIWSLFDLFLFYSEKTLILKGARHELFDFRFFTPIIFLLVPEFPMWEFSNVYENSRWIFETKG
jgi:hypothetical protein